MATGAVLMLAGLTAAHAAAPDRFAAATKVAAANPPVHPVAAVERDDEATCSRARRRLWITGEGWVVRRIITCR